MESHFREFEDFIKESADQYRMFPSDRVWKGVHNTLHTRRKWYGAGLAFLLLLTATAVTWVMVTYPVPKNQSAVMVKVPNRLSAQPVSTASPETIQQTILPFSNPPATPGPVATPAAVNQPVAETDRTEPGDEEMNVVAERVPSPVVAPVVKHKPAQQLTLIPETLEEAITSNTQATERTVADQPVAFTEPSYPLTIESVTNAYQPKKAKKKISWQLYITPTVSYRKLSENKSSDHDAALAGFPFASLTDVNKAVTHKPDMGFQLGVMARYPVSKRLKIRAGLQFNMNRYDIRAFAYNPEVATITLDGSNGGTTAVSTWTYYRNYNGYKTNWLKNLYFSVSAPIGAEMRLIGNDKTNFGIAGTIQPTYIIKDRAYLLSTDYKNYATFPWLVRNINLNTGFEAFVNYTTGKTRWQIGPQVRYQVLSSFHNRYPVKENLFDFGVKMGVTLNN